MTVSPTASEIPSTPTKPAPAPEPWLSGSRTETPAAGRAVLHALDLAMDDIEKWIAGLSDEQLNAEPHGLPSIAFHLRHIARSTDRILSYAEGAQLTESQLGLLKVEKGGATATCRQLLDELCEAFTRAESRIRELAATDLEAPRFVGRKQLPTSVGGALIHVADHTQRHVGQVVTTAKLLKAPAVS